MTSDGVKNCLAIIKSNYMNLFEFDEMGFKALHNLYMIQFKDIDDSELYYAIQIYIRNNSYPPKISDLVDILYDNDHNLPSDEDMWSIVYKSGCRGNYNPHEEWEKLPNELKEIVSVNTIREIANSSDESLRFIKKDFLQNLKVMRESHKRDEKALCIINNIKSIDNKETTKYLG